MKTHVTKKQETADMFFFFSQYAIAYTDFHSLLQFFRTGFKMLKNVALFSLVLSFTLINGQEVKSYFDLLLTFYTNILNSIANLTLDNPK